MGLSTGCACRDSTAVPCSAASSADPPPATSPSGLRVRRWSCLAPTAPSTATLETTWDCGGGRLTLAEGMIAEVTGTLLPSTLLVRRITATGGPVDAVVDFDPRLGEHHQRPHVDHRGNVVV